MLQVVPLSPPEDEGAIALEDLEDLDKQSGSQEAQCARLSSALRSAPDFEVKEEKEGSDASSDARSQSLSPEGVSWRLKIPALICVLLFTLGSNWAASILGPLKSTIRAELDASNAQYGVIVSANNLVNTLIPILSGLAVDHYGPNSASLVSSVLNLLGTLVAAIGTSTKSFSTLVVGQIILGFGSQTIETAQSKLYTRWFYSSRHLGLVYGLDVAVGRVVNVVAGATSVPIKDGTGSWTWSFWVAAIMCAITLVINIGYCLLARKMVKVTRAGSDVRSVRSSTQRQKMKASWLSLDAVPAAFWIILITQTMQGGTVGSWMNVSADVIRQTRGTTTTVAGYTSAVGQVIPIFLTPVLGTIMDRFGRRMYFVTATAALYVLAFALIQFTGVHTLVPFIISSFALAMNSLPFLASIPLLVADQRHFGLAFGLWYTYENCGQVMTDVIAGAIQDATAGASYVNVFYFFIAVKSLAVLNGLFYDVLDRRKLGGVLRVSEDRRLAEEQQRTSLSESPLKRPQRSYTAVGLAWLAVLVVVAWALYLVYARPS